MIKRLIAKNRELLTRPQESILSAAVVITVMIALSRVLGLVRNRVLAHFFAADDLSIYFAAFRVPEVIFEVLVFGTLSAAFVPIFTTYLSKDDKREAWYVAGVSLNLALLAFAPLALIIFIFSNQIYSLITPGFSSKDIILISGLSRVLLVAQGLFIISYFLTGVLESLKRFLIPAIAPLFYNLGIIIGAAFLSGPFGIYGPVIGAALGALLHVLIQLPFAWHFGFRPRAKLDIHHPGVRQIGKLALPRVIELLFLEVGKTVELFLSSFMATASYAYFTFANSLQLVPVGLVGTSIAKASLPTLSYQAANGEKDKFRETLITCFNEINFLVIPLAVFLAVLRIPVVRLIFGAAKFDWEATIETSRTLSAFALGIASQSTNYLLVRAFYAVKDTGTPVKISIGGMIFNIIAGSLFTLVFHLPVWSLALAFSLSSIAQMFFLSKILSEKIEGLSLKSLFVPLWKTVFAAGCAGGAMFLLAKILDRSVWSKQLSFLGKIGLTLPTNFEKFVFDTRYVGNVIFLMAVILIVGVAVYFGLAWALKIKESVVLFKFLAKIKKIGTKSAQDVKEESITITPNDGS